MTSNQLIPGTVYFRDGARARQLVSVRNDRAIYVVQGLTTLVPLTMSVRAFAEWAQVELSSKE